MGVCPCAHRSPSRQQVAKLSKELHRARTLSLSSTEDLSEQVTASRRFKAEQALLAAELLRTEQITGAHQHHEEAAAAAALAQVHASHRERHWNEPPQAKQIVGAWDVKEAGDTRDSC